MLLLLLLLLLYARESLLENASVFKDSNVCNEADSHLKGRNKCYCQCQNAFTTYCYVS